MSKPIRLSYKQWANLEKKLMLEYPKSVMILRYKMKEVLGFTPRVHLAYDEETGPYRHVCLDFYDDRVKTMFVLKYSEYLNDYRT